MLSISIGPLAFPVAPLVLLTAIWAASAVASSIAGRAAARAVAADAGPVVAAEDVRGGDPTDARAVRRDQAGHAVFVAALVGLAAARAVHLASNWDAYRQAGWAALDVRDGGWHSATGWAVAAAWLAALAWRHPALRQALAAGAAVAVLVWAGGTAAARLAAGGQTPAGLPDVALRDLRSGEIVSLAAAVGGRPAVVNLWASWCGPCREEMPMLEAAQRRHPGIRFLFVNQGESEAAIRAYLAGTGLQLEGVLLDANSAMGRAVGSRGLPTTLFYDAQGRRVDAHFGVLNAASLEARLRPLRTPP